MQRNETNKHRSGWRRRRRKRERPEEILKAALAIVRRKGYDATRIEDIAECAGISKGTIYLYFSGKADLLEAIKQNAR